MDEGFEKLQELKDLENELDPESADYAAKYATYNQKLTDYNSYLESANGTVFDRYKDDV
jgi:hypothetical protein